MPREIKTHCKNGHEFAVVGKCRSQCRECKRKLSSKYYYKNRAKCIANRNKYRLSETNRYSNVKLKDYVHLLENQNNKCLICNSEFDNKKVSKRACLDHDHSNGKIRGFLCSSCNVGLGNFKDNIDYLAKAIEYLKAS